MLAVRLRDCDDGRVGATEQQTVAALYLVASVIQFAAFVVLRRLLGEDYLKRREFIGD